MAPVCVHEESLVNMKDIETSKFLPQQVLNVNL